MRIVGAFAAFALLAAAAAARDAAVPAGPDYREALAASQASVGRRIGDHALVDPNHRRIALSDFRGRPLLVSFVYTGCIDVCRTTTRYLEKAIAEARAALGPESFNVITVGFNQPFDSPEAMGAFARQHGIRDPFWRFLSADARTASAITRDFGFTYYATPKGFDHISQLAIVDASGAIYRQVYGETFELPLLVAPLKELMSGQASDAGYSGLWDKVKLFCTVYDPNSGGYRLNYSLFIEIFAGSTVLAAIGWIVLREYRRSGA